MFVIKFFNEILKQLYCFYKSLIKFFDWISADDCIWKKLELSESSECYYLYDHFHISMKIWTLFLTLIESNSFFLNLTEIESIFVQYSWFVMNKNFESYLIFSCWLHKKRFEFSKCMTLNCLRIILTIW